MFVIFLQLKKKKTCIEETSEAFPVEDVLYLKIFNIQSNLLRSDNIFI